MPLSLRSLGSTIKHTVGWLDHSLPPPSYMAPYFLDVLGPLCLQWLVTEGIPAFFFYSTGHEGPVDSFHHYNGRS